MRGLVAAVVTPMNAKGDLDLESCSPSCGLSRVKRDHRDLYSWKHWRRDVLDR